MNPESLAFGREVIDVDVDTRGSGSASEGEESEADVVVLPPVPRAPIVRPPRRPATPDAAGPAMAVDVSEDTDVAEASTAYGHDRVGAPLVIGNTDERVVGIEPPTAADDAAAKQTDERQARNTFIETRRRTGDTARAVRIYKNELIADAVVDTPIGNLLVCSETATLALTDVLHADELVSPLLCGTANVYEQGDEYGFSDTVDFVGVAAPLGSADADDAAPATLLRAAYQHTFQFTAGRYDAALPVTALRNAGVIHPPTVAASLARQFLEVTQRPVRDGVDVAAVDREFGIELVLEQCAIGAPELLGRAYSTAEADAELRNHATGEFVAAVLAAPLADARASATNAIWRAKAVDREQGWTEERARLQALADIEDALAERYEGVADAVNVVRFERGQPVGVRGALLEYALDDIVGSLTRATARSLDPLADRLASRLVVGVASIDALVPDRTWRRALQTEEPRAAVGRVPVEDVLRRPGEPVGPPPAKSVEAQIERAPKRLRRREPETTLGDARPKRKAGEIELTRAERQAQGEDLSDEDDDEESVGEALDSDSEDAEALAHALIDDGYDAQGLNGGRQVDLAAPGIVASAELPWPVLAVPRDWNAEETLGTLAAAYAAATSGEAAIDLWQRGDVWQAIVTLALYRKLVPNLGGSVLFPPEARRALVDTLELVAERVRREVEFCTAARRYASESARVRRARAAAAEEAVPADDGRVASTVVPALLALRFPRELAYLAPLAEPSIETGALTAAERVGLALAYATADARPVGVRDMLRTEPIAWPDELAHAQRHYPVAPFLRAQALETLFNRGDSTDGVEAVRRFLTLVGEPDAPAARDLVAANAGSVLRAAYAASTSELRDAALVAVAYDAAGERGAVHEVKSIVVIAPTPLVSAESRRLALRQIPYVFNDSGKFDTGYLIAREEERHADEERRAALALTERGSERLVANAAQLYVQDTSASLHYLLETTAVVRADANVDNVDDARPTAAFFHVGGVLDINVEDTRALLLSRSVLGGGRVRLASVPVRASDQATELIATLDARAAVAAEHATAAADEVAILAEALVAEPNNRRIGRELADARSRVAALAVERATMANERADAESVARRRAALASRATASFLYFLPPKLVVFVAAQVATRETTRLDVRAVCAAFARTYAASISKDISREYLRAIAKLDADLREMASERVFTDATIGPAPLEKFVVAAIGLLATPSAPRLLAMRIESTAPERVATQPFSELAAFERAVDPRRADVRDKLLGVWYGISRELQWKRAGYMSAPFNSSHAFWLPHTLADPSSATVHTLLGVALGHDDDVEPVDEPDESVDPRVSGRLELQTLRNAIERETAAVHTARTYWFDAAVVCRDGPAFAAAVRAEQRTLVAAVLSGRSLALASLLGADETRDSGDQPTVPLALDPRAQPVVDRFWRAYAHAARVRDARLELADEYDSTEAPAEQQPTIETPLDVLARRRRGERGTAGGATRTLADAIDEAHDTAIGLAAVTSAVAAPGVLADLALPAEDEARAVEQARAQRAADAKATKVRGELPRPDDNVIDSFARDDTRIAGLLHEVELQAQSDTSVARVSDLKVYRDGRESLTTLDVRWRAAADRFRGSYYDAERLAEIERADERLASVAADPTLSADRRLVAVRFFETRRRALLYADERAARLRKLAAQGRAAAALVLAERARGPDRSPAKLAAAQRARRAAQLGIESLLWPEERRVRDEAIEARNAEPVPVVQQLPDQRAAVADRVRALETSPLLDEDDRRAVPGSYDAPLANHKSIAVRGALVANRLAAATRVDTATSVMLAGESAATVVRLYDIAQRLLGERVGGKLPLISPTDERAAKLLVHISSVISAVVDERILVRETALRELGLVPPGDVAVSRRATRRTLDAIFALEPSTTRLAGHTYTRIELAALRVVARRYAAWLRASRASQLVGALGDAGDAGEPMPRVLALLLAPAAIERAKLTLQARFEAGELPYARPHRVGYAGADRSDASQAYRVAEIVARYALYCELPIAPAPTVYAQYIGVRDGQTPLTRLVPFAARAARLRGEPGEPQLHSIGNGVHSAAPTAATLFLAALGVRLMHVYIATQPNAPKTIRDLHLVTDADKTTPTRRIASLPSARTRLWAHLAMFAGPFGKPFAAELALELGFDAKYGMLSIVDMRASDLRLFALAVLGFDATARIDRDVDNTEQTDDDVRTTPSYVHKRSQAAKFLLADAHYSAAIDAFYRVAPSGAGVTSENEAQRETIYALAYDDDEVLIGTDPHRLEPIRTALPRGTTTRHLASGRTVVAAVNESRMRRAYDRTVRAEWTRAAASPATATMQAIPASDALSLWRDLIGPTVDAALQSVAYSTVATIGPDLPARQRPRDLLWVLAPRAAVVLALVGRALATPAGGEARLYARHPGRYVWERNNALDTLERALLLLDDASYLLRDDTAVSGEPIVARYAGVSLPPIAAAPVLEAPPPVAAPPRSPAEVAAIAAAVDEPAPPPPTSDVDGWRAAVEERIGRLFEAPGKARLVGTRIKTFADDPDPFAAVSVHTRLLEYENAVTVRYLAGTPKLWEEALEPVIRRLREIFEERLVDPLVPLTVLRVDEAAVAVSSGTPTGEIALVRLLARAEFERRRRWPVGAASTVGTLSIVADGDPRSAYQPWHVLFFDAMAASFPATEATGKTILLCYADARQPTDSAATQAAREQARLLSRKHSQPIFVEQTMPVYDALKCMFTTKKGQFNMLDQRHPLLPLLGAPLAGKTFVRVQTVEVSGRVATACYVRLAGSVSNKFAAAFYPSTVAAANDGAAAAAQLSLTSPDVVVLHEHTFAPTSTAGATKSARRLGSSFKTVARVAFDGAAAPYALDEALKRAIERGLIGLDVARVMPSASYKN